MATTLKAKASTRDWDYATLPKLRYTEVALAEELTFRLSSFNACHVEEDLDNNMYIRIHHPYLQQAEANLYKCNIYEYPPQFVIFKDDLPKWLVDALAALDKVAMKRIITDAVRRIYESVDPEYFHMNGIYGKVNWTVVTKEVS
jgi:hypothetical protein